VVVDVRGIVVDDDEVVDEDDVVDEEVVEATADVVVVMTLLLTFNL